MPKPSVVREAAEVTVRNDQSGSFDASDAVRWSAARDATLGEAIGRAVDGIPTVLVVEGAPGFGKTTYLRHLAATAHGFHLLQFQADREWQQPYAALIEWGVLDPASAADLTAPQAARMLRSWIEKIRSGAPALIMIDDLEYLDIESSDAVARLIERTFSDRILVAVAADSLAGQALDPWNRLAMDVDRAIRLELTGLEETAVVELTARAWPEADAALGKRLWVHTGGNPLFLRAILHEHTLEEVRDADELPAPADLLRSFAARLRRLDAEGAALLRAAVVLADRWTPLLSAGMLAGLEDPAPAARRLHRRGVLMSRTLAGRTEVRVASGVIPTAFAETIPPAERRALHRRAAELVDAPIDALRHRFLATDGYDDDLAADLETAAWSSHLARRFRQASRVGLWASAVTAAPVVRERRLLEALFDAVLARDFDVIERRLGGVGYAYDEARRAVVAGFAHVSRGHWSRASAVLLSIPSAAIEATDGRTRFRLHVLLAWTQLVTGGSSDRARQELALARAQPADPCLSGYFGFASALASDAGMTGSPARVTDGLELDSAWLGAAAAVGGMPDVAVRHLAPFAARIDEGLVAMGDGEFHALLGYAYWLRGDWRAARELINVSLAARYGATNPLIRAVAVLADLAGGETGALARHRDEARATLRDAPWPLAIATAATAEFVCLRLAGQRDEQTRYLDELTADFGTISWPGARPPLWLLTLGMINAAGRRSTAVRDLAAQLAGHPRPVGWREAGVAWLEGLAADVDGDQRKAARLLSQARAVGVAELRIHASLLAADLARVRRGLGDEIGAVSAQRESDDLLAGIDEARYLIVPAADPLAPLSERERQVVALLTQGLSYAQIAKELYVSRSTVAFHLSNIYAKTATESRHGLVELVRRSATSLGVA